MNLRITIIIGDLNTSSGENTSFLKKICSHASQQRKSPSCLLLADSSHMCFICILYIKCKTFSDSINSEGQVLAPECMLKALHNKSLTNIVECITSITYVMLQASPSTTTPKSTCSVLHLPPQCYLGTCGALWTLVAVHTTGSLLSVSKPQFLC